MERSVIPSNQHVVEFFCAVYSCEWWHIPEVFVCLAFDMLFSQWELRTCKFRNSIEWLSYHQPEWLDILDSSNGARVSRPLVRNIANSTRKWAKVQGRFLLLIAFCFCRFDISRTKSCLWAVLMTRNCAFARCDNWRSSIASFFIFRFMFPLNKKQ